MRYVFFLCIVVSIICVVVGCSQSQTHLGPKVEAIEYDEEQIELKNNSSLKIECDSANIEFFSWDKRAVKFEISKKIRGVNKKDNLKEKLNNFIIDSNTYGNEVLFKSRYKQKIKNPADIFVDLKVYYAKSLKKINLELDVGKVKFHDDVKGILNADINMANVDINKIEGVLKINANMGDVRISGGKLKGITYVKQDIGNTTINTAFEEGGHYEFETNMGNIDLLIPKKSKIRVESLGTVDDNHFTDNSYPTAVRVKSGMGKISVKGY